MAATVEVVEDGRVLAFSLDDVMRFHGGGSPGGAALGFKALERALPLLAAGGRCERRALTVETAFGGPGARDAFELVTRAASDGRYAVDAALRRPALGPARERFVFTLRHHERAVTLTLREGVVSDEFAALAFATERDAHQEARLEALKRALADDVAGRGAADVFDATHG